jgi:hypothetical protein
VLTEDEASRIASNIAKLPTLHAKSEKNSNRPFGFGANIRVILDGVGRKSRATARKLEELRTVTFAQASEQFLATDTNSKARQ